MHEVVKRREIKPDADRVRARVAEMGSTYDDSEQFARWYYEDKNRLAQVEAVVVEEQAIEELLSEAKITETAITFDEFMRPATPTSAPVEGADS
jgi:trigger factor